jgi:hypothetical protein
MVRIQKPLLFVLALGLTSIAFSQQQPTKSITGSYSTLRYDAGNTYGYKFVIYTLDGYWIVFHQADMFKPCVAELMVKGNTIEFTIPSDIDLTKTRTFKGTITNKFLVGYFDDSSHEIKLKRGPL